MTQSVSHLLTNAFHVDKKWLATIPISSTHFINSSNTPMLLPNRNKVQTTINLMDVLNPQFVNDINTKCHFSDLNYPSTFGLSAILQIEGYIGDDDTTVSKIQNDIISVALQNSTKLKSKVRKAPTRK